MKTAVWVIVAIIILGGGWWYFGMRPAMPAPATTDTTATDLNSQTPTVAATDTGATSTPAPASAPMSANVIYGAQGYSPSTVTIAKGGTVTWVSQSGSSMWTASNEHPSHTGYAGTTRQQHCPDTTGAAFDQCSPGTSYSFTFSKAGTWKYHNHMKAEDQGVVVVQ